MLTNKLKPVTLAKEVAMEAPERDNSPRWPTNMIEMRLREYCRRETHMRGPANHNCFCVSSNTPSPSPSPFSCEIILIRGDFMWSSSSLPIWSVIFVCGYRVIQICFHYFPFIRLLLLFISIKIRRITLIYVSKNLPFKSQVTHKLLENSNFCNHINYYWKRKKQENIGSKTQLVLSQLFAFIRFALWTHWVTCFDKKCETEARLNSINFFQQFIEFYKTRLRLA